MRGENVHVNILVERESELPIQGGDSDVSVVHAVTEINAVSSRRRG